MLGTDLHRKRDEEEEDPEGQKQGAERRRDQGLRELRRIKAEG